MNNKAKFKTFLESLKGHRQYRWGVGDGISVRWFYVG